MTASHRNEADPVRRSILAAMDRLLTGVPARSTGRLSVSQLAVEADVERWRLTHQHTDLKDLFQSRARDLESRRGASIAAVDELASLRNDHAELRRHCADLEQRLRTYATVINLLTLENTALAGREPDIARVLPMARRAGPERHRPNRR